MTFREWPSRGAMAVTIRIQQSRESRSDDWKPCIPLMDAEGHEGFRAKTLAELSQVFECRRAYMWVKRDIPKVLTYQGEDYEFNAVAE